MTPAKISIQPWEDRLRKGTIVNLAGLKLKVLLAWEEPNYLGGPRSVGGYKFTILDPPSLHYSEWISLSVEYVNRYGEIEK